MPKSRRSERQRQEIQDTDAEIGKTQKSHILREEKKKVRAFAEGLIRIEENKRKKEKKKTYGSRES